jgi:FHA domain
MIRTAEQLTQCLQAVYQFSLSRKSRLEGLSNVTQNLDKINIIINSRRLNFQIFSQFSLLCEGMSNWLHSNQALNNFYGFQKSELPAFTSSSSQSQFPKLVLRANPGVSQSEAIYKLSLNQSIIIGRDLEGQTSSRLIEVPLPMYRKISGRHAEICNVSSLNPTSLTWQICDLNSTNGTYINGQKIKGCETLKSGDRVTLGYPNPSEKAPELIFEGQVQNSTQRSSVIQQVEGDLICLVISPDKELSDSEKQLIDQASQAEIAGFIIIADNSGLSSADNQKAIARLSSIKSSIQNQLPRLSEILETIVLPLHFFYPNILPAPLTPPVQQIFSELSANLIALAENQGGKILINRANRQLQDQLQHIDSILSEQQEALNKEIQRTELILQRRNIESLRDHFIEGMKQVSEERDYFFQQVRNNFGRASNDFISDIIPDNLLQSIEDFVENLDPVVNKQKGQVSIELKTNNKGDLYKEILYFIRSEIIRWSDKHWQFIYYKMSGDGLEGLSKRSYTRLNSLPSFQMDNPFHQLPQKLEIANKLNTSFTNIKVDIAYGESSGSDFNGMARIAMMTASTAMSIGASISAGQNLSPQAIMQGANVISALSGMSGASVSKAQQQKLKIEQIVDSLKRNTRSHYQKIARHLLNTASQEIVSAINTEDRLFRKSLERIDEQFRSYYAEFKTITETYKARQQALDQDRQAFESIKRLAG